VKNQTLLRTAVLAAALLATAAAAGARPAHRTDLADTVAGSYAGDVISDSQGSSRENVALDVTRVGPNSVRITSPYTRLPPITVRLTSATGRIVNAGGDSPFVFDPTRNPPHLDVSFNNEVSWSGQRR
jgi:hypothetical protein